jgi:uncharacterized damage-inducible protein DinB
MMNRQALTGFWDHLRQMNGIALRAIAALPADQLDSHPIPNMRTPKELVVHLYESGLRALVVGVAEGEVKVDEQAEAKIVARIQSKDQLLAFGRECWDAADRAAATLTDAQLAGTVKTSFGKPYPSGAMVSAAGDEFLHHRGQLYAYLRALGVAPPEMWDFAHNEAAFQPTERAHA